MGKCIDQRSWEEFRKTGLILIVNQILHIFGWALTYEVYKEPTSGEVKITNVYPARTKFRGFESKDVDESYTKVTMYLKENIDQLVKDTKEED